MGEKNSGLRVFARARSVFQLGAETGLNCGRWRKTDPIYEPGRKVLKEEKEISTATFITA